MAKISIKDLTKDQIEDLKRQLKVQDTKVKGWRPEKGENYYTVYCDSIHNHSWQADSIDESNLKTDNCFKTQEEAEKHMEYLEALYRVKEYINDNWFFEPNWGDSNESKYYIMYWHDDGKFDVDSNQSLEISCVLPRVKTCNAAKDVIENCEEDLKIIFNV